MKGPAPQGLVKIREVTKQEIAGLLAMVQRATKVGDEEETKDWCDVDKDEPIKLPRSFLAPGVLRGFLGTGMRYRVILHGNCTVGTLANGKYKVGFNGVDGYSINGVTSVSEFSSLASIFSEYYVRKVTFHYEPDNWVGGSIPGFGGAGSSQAFLNNSLMVVGAVQHATAVATDNSSAVNVVADDGQHLITNSGKPWSFAWRNIDKFSWDAQLDPSASSQGWKAVSDTAYGGTVEGAFPRAAATATSITQMGINSTLGYAVVKYDVCFRYRE
jgi:hypothetical protein